MDFPLLLADSEFPWGTVVTAILAGIGAIWAAAKGVWHYWTSRLDKLLTDHAKAMQQKDKEHADVIKTMLDEHADALKAKDAQLKKMVEGNAEQARAHAEKVEELQTITLDKVEGWGNRQLELVEKQIAASVEQTAVSREVAAALRAVEAKLDELKHAVGDVIRGG